MTETKAQNECPYCHDKKTIVEEDDIGAYVLIRINCLFVEPRIVKPGGNNGTGRPISYCPVCGRKLEAGK